MKKNKIYFSFFILAFSAFSFASFRQVPNLGVPAVPASFLQTPDGRIFSVAPQVAFHVPQVSTLVHPGNYVLVSEDLLQSITQTNLNNKAQVTLVRSENRRIKHELNQTKLLQDQLQKKIEELKAKLKKSSKILRKLRDSSEAVYLAYKNKKREEAARAKRKKRVAPEALAADYGKVNFDGIANL